MQSQIFSKSLRITVYCLKKMEIICSLSQLNFSGFGNYEQSLKKKFPRQSWPKYLEQVL